MEREIKFRAWDDVEQRFWTLKDGGETSGDGSVQYFGNEVGVLEIGRLEEFDVGDMWSSQFTPFPISQYSGLKDKNGREIYESDILLWDEKEFGRPFKEIVKWDYEQFSMRLRDWGQFCEVIGNIYEDGDLLGRNND